MNERIQKWLKNHLVRSEYTQFGWQECHRYEFDEHELEKFAELIVRECLSYAKDGDIDFMKFMIKKHFGVEE
jgi:hypothetical protein